MEATGTYSDALALFLHQAGHAVSVVNPARIKGFAESELRRNKTDRADAALIALFARQKNPELWHPPAAEARQLQILVRHLDDLIEQQTQLSNRLTEGRLVPAVRASLETLLGVIAEQVREIERQIESHFEQHPRLKADRALLVSIPGIGEKTAARLLAEMACWGGGRERVASGRLCRADPAPSRIGELDQVAGAPVKDRLVTSAPCTLLPGHRGLAVQPAGPSSGRTLGATGQAQAGDHRGGDA
jgi:transposase